MGKQFAPVPAHFTCENHQRRTAVSCEHRFGRKRPGQSRDHHVRPSVPAKNRQRQRAACEQRGDYQTGPEGYGPRAPHRQAGRCLHHHRDMPLLAAKTLFLCANVPEDALRASVGETRKGLNFLHKQKR